MKKKLIITSYKGQNTFIVNTIFAEIGSTLSSFFGGSSYSGTEDKEKETKEGEREGEGEGEGEEEKQSEEQRMEEGAKEDSSDTPTEKEEDESESVAEGNEIASLPFFSGFMSHTTFDCMSSPQTCFVFNSIFLGCGSNNYNYNCKISLIF